MTSSNNPMQADLTPIRNQQVDCITLATPRKIAAFGDGFDTD